MGDDDVDTSNMLYVRDPDHEWILAEKIEVLDNGKISVKLKYAETDYKDQGACGKCPCRCGNDLPLSDVVPGWTNSVNGYDGVSRNVKEDDTRDVDPSHLAPPGQLWNIAKLNGMTEASLIEVVRRRFCEGHIHTLVSDILIIINPYIFCGKNIDIMDASNYVLHTTPPHVFTTAASGYEMLMDQGSKMRNQSAVVSGESGAGKTEACKAIMRYLAEVEIIKAKSDPPSDVVKEDMAIEAKVMACSPFLEAFGNAKTIMNDNSSRFGKFLMIWYLDGRIQGAEMTMYLLEKGRIANQGPNERNYHIFYFMLKGMRETNPEQLAEMGLGTCEDYKSIIEGGCIDVPKINDVKEWKEMQEAMADVGIDPDTQQRPIWGIVAALLELGNCEWVERTPGDDDPDPTICECSNPDVIARSAKHFGVDETGPSSLMKKLSVRMLVKPGSITTVPVEPSKAKDAASALAKAVYCKVFDWLGDVVNRALKPTGPKDFFFGILDIFGFEIFEKNSFEQLCINFANEKLQRMFNKHVFELEQVEYEEEGIDFSKVSFKDNTPCCTLVEHKSKYYIGLMPRLDDKSKRDGKGNTDEAFATEMVKYFKRDKHLEKNLMKELGNQKHVDVYLGAAEFIKFSKTQPYDWFEIQHFAGSVRYYFENFITKNKDKLFPHLVDLINGSEIPFTAALMSSGGGGKKKSKKPEVPTIASKFVKQLKELCDTMEKTVPHYVRCVKPNSLKLNFLAGINAGCFEANKAMRQLRYAGVMETVAIRRAGYPVRETFPDFWSRCQTMGWDVLAGVTSSGDMAADGKAILKIAIGGSDETGQWVIGKTKIFGKETLLKDLAKWQQGQVVAILQLFARSKLERLERFLPWRKALLQRRAEEMATDLVKIQAALRGAIAINKLKEARIFRENYAIIINQIGDSCVACSRAAADYVEKLVTEAKEVADLAEKNADALRAIKAAADACEMCAEAVKVVDRLATLALEKAAQAKYEFDNKERIFKEKKAAKINSGCRRHMERLRFHDAIAKTVKIQHKRRRLQAKRAIFKLREGAAGFQSLVRGAIQRKDANIKKRAAAKVSDFLLGVSVGHALDIWVKEMAKACSEGNDVLIQRLLLRSDQCYSMIRSMEVKQAVQVRHKKSGKTFFHMAAINGSVDTLSVLFSAGSEVATKDMLGRTPLIETCAAGDARLEVSKFIYRQARKEPELQAWMIQTSSTENKTCLDCALESSDGDKTVAWLTQLGAFNSSDAVGMTPEELGAEIARRRDEAKLMESKMDARREARRAKRQQEAAASLQQSLAVSQAAVAAAPATPTRRANEPQQQAAGAALQPAAQAPYGGGVGSSVGGAIGGGGGAAARGSPAAASRFQAPQQFHQAGVPSVAPTYVQPAPSGFNPAAGAAPSASAIAAAAPNVLRNVAGLAAAVPGSANPGVAVDGVPSAAVQYAGAAPAGAASAAPAQSGGLLARDAASQLMSLLMQAAGGMSGGGGAESIAEASSGAAKFDPVIAGRSRYAMPSPSSQSPYAAPTQWSATPAATASAPAPAPSGAGVPVPPVPSTPTPPSEWREVRSGSGLRYYYNVRTRESSWEAPASFDVHTPAAPSISSPAFTGPGPVTPAARRNVAQVYPSSTAPSGSAATTPTTRVQNRNPNVALWSIATVGSWLLELNLGEHLVAFRDAAVDGDMLLDLTNEDLLAIGVAHPMHRKKVLKRVERLRGGAAAAMSTPSKVSGQADDYEGNSKVADGLTFGGSDGGAEGSTSIQTWLQRALLTMSSSVSGGGGARGWSYVDENGAVQGEFKSDSMKSWYAKGYLSSGLQVRYGDGAFITLSELYPEGCGNAFELDSRRDLEQARSALTGVLGM